MQQDKNILIAALTGSGKTNDIQKKLQDLLCGIYDALNERQLPSVDIRIQACIGDAT